jgi:hypothetical protein
MDDLDVDWETCAADGCAAARLPTSGKCWVHAADVGQALERLHDTGQLDARGVPITKELLQRLLAAAPKSDHGRPALTNPRFDKAIFKGKATFKGGPGFYGTSFKGTASFGGATFEGDASFGGATFEGDAGFYGAIFEGTAAFHGATFKGKAWFDGATFKGEARFVEARFQRDAEFDRAIFHGDAWFNRVRVNHDAYFLEATFQHARQLGPMLVRKSLVLDGAIFHERAQIQVSTAALCCRRTRFLAGMQLWVRWAEVALGLSDFAAPSVLTDARAFPGLEEGRWARALERLRTPNDRGSRPRLLAVRRADVANLTVSYVDLRACRFLGAHHLDQLRIEECDFPLAPKSWRWTTRQTIAEEHHWRATHPRSLGVGPPTPHDTAAVDDQRRQSGHHVGWYRPDHRPPGWLETTPPARGLPAWPTVSPGAAQIAALYRALRKGREDNKDEPGAADFYYGEMEMRRHAKREEATAERHDRHYRRWAAATTERAVLWLYWLVAGYGLRAWRALTALAVAVLLASVVFAFWGFAPPDDPAIRVVAVDPRGAPIYALRPPQRPAGLDELPTAIRFSAQATTALLRGPDRPLTALGEWTDMALRLVGPVLLGLSVLSIRNRIKR